MLFALANTNEWIVLRSKYALEPMTRPRMGLRLAYISVACVFWIDLLIYLTAIPNTLRTRERVDRRYRVGTLVLLAQVFTHEI